LRTLFDHAVRAGMRVRTETALGHLATDGYGLRHSCRPVMPTGFPSRSRPVGQQVAYPAPSHSSTHAIRSPGLASLQLLVARESPCPGHRYGRYDDPRHW
jgi:hypothetical protein